ncbi:MAG: YkgJ family cysteine cluster protein [Halioglobus sp.]
MRECNQCGKCCIAYSDGGLTASAEEIENWETFRPDIAAYVSNGEIWMDPGSGRRLKRCPWLQELPYKRVGQSALYTCGIYDDRPEDCRLYPTLIAEMVRDGCEMIELRDLDDPKEAQRELDLIMAESRPPLA